MSSASSSSSKSIFKGKRIFINNDINPPVREKLASLIQTNGGTVVPDKSNQHDATDESRFDLKTTTHVVTAGIHFKEYEKCWDSNNADDPYRQAAETDTNPSSKTCVVVSSQWVRRSLQIGLLDSPIGHSPHPDAIFSGAVVCTTNLSTECTLQIRAMVEAWGGRTSSNLTREVTHLLTDKRRGIKYDSIVRKWKDSKAAGPPDSTLEFTTDDKKLVEPRYNLPLVLLPSWVEHSFKRHEVVDPLPYKFDLDNPKQMPHVVDSVIKQVENEDSELKSVATRNDRDHSNRDGVPLNEKVERTGSGKKELKEGIDPEISKYGLAGKVVLFSTEVLKQSRPETLSAFQSQISEAGGKLFMLTAPEEPQDDLDPSQVTQAIRNADIVICMYRDDMECVEAYKIGGKLIGTIEYLISIMKYGRLSSPLSNVLHFPRPPGICPEFGNLYMTISKYEGPSRAYLKKLVERLGARFTPDLTKVNTHVVTSAKEGEKVESGITWGLEIVNHYWLEACFVAWKRLPLSHNPRFTDFELPASIVKSVVGNTKLDETLITRWFQDLEQEQALKDIVMEDAEEQPQDEEMNGVDTTADQSRNLDPDVTPRVVKKSKSRASKAAQDQNGEASGSVTVPKSGKKRSSSPEKRNGATGRKVDEEADELEQEEPQASTSAPAPKKKKVSKKSEEPAGDVSVGEASTSKTPKGKSSSKKALKSTPPMEIDEEEDDSEPPIFYVTTGYNLKPAQETALNKLGATFQDQFDKNTNLLIAGGKISRTEKFLRALAKGDVAIVDGKWVEDVVKSKQIKPFSDYPLYDKEGESKFNSALKAGKKDMQLSLKKSLQRASRYAGVLLKGHTFYFGPHFEKDSASAIMRSVILEAGGKCPSKPKWNLIASDPENHHLIADASKESKDRATWEKETKNLNVSGVNVWKKELISAGILRMKMDYEEDIIATLD